MKYIDIEWAVNLDLDKIDLGQDAFAAFHEFSYQIAEDLKAPLNYYSCLVGREHLENRKIGNKRHLEFIEQNFRGMWSYSLDSHEVRPYRNQCALLLCLHFAQVHGRYRISITCNDGLCPFLHSQRAEIVKRIVNFRKWSYGCGDHWPTYKILSGWVSGGSTYYYWPPSMKQRVYSYNGASREEKLTRFRGVFPLNILNDTQIAQPVSESESLMDYIRRQPDSTLERCNNLWIWEIQEDKVPEVCRDLHGTGAVIEPLVDENGEAVCWQSL